MALTLVHGFDHENASADLVGGGIVTPLNNGLSNPPAVALGSGGSRWGVGNYLEISDLYVSNVGAGWQSNAVAFPIAGTAPTAGFAGCAAIVTEQMANSQGGWILALYDAINAAVQCCAFLRNDGVVQIWRGLPGTGTELGAVANAYIPGAWQFVEFGGGIGASENASVRINGATVLALTGVNTQNTGSTTFESVAVFCGPVANPQGPMAMNLDDLYFCDASGAAPQNSFLGDVRVLTGFPNAAGASTQFTPLANANWQEVSEIAMDGNTSFNASSTAGAIDLFPTGVAVPATATVFGVQISTAVCKTDSLVHTLSPLVKSGTNTGTGAADVIGSAYGYIEALFETDPNTALAWTAAAVNAAQVGYEMVS